MMLDHSPPMATRQFQRSFRVCTPMFCGGANQDTSEVRLQSVKGMIRFWCRSLMGHQCKSVEELHNAEAELFGSSDSEIGQSKLRMRIQLTQSGALETQNWDNGRPVGGIYLAYGMMKDRKETGWKPGALKRPFRTGVSFELVCRVRDQTNRVDESFQQITDAIDLWSCVGALGAKSRKGFGSVCPTGDQAARDPKEVIKKLMTRYQTQQCQSPEWTAWSGGSRVVFIQSNDNDAMNLLEKIGQELLLFRGWGHDKDKRGYHKVWPGQPSEQNFFNDHERFKKPVISIGHPQRVAFGLPHNYGPQKHQEVEPASHKRRGSPLFIHIHQPDPKIKPTAVLSFLPAKFLPVGEPITAFGKSAPVAGAPGLWDPIHAFLDRLTHEDQQPRARHAGYADFGERPRDDEEESKPWWVRDNKDLVSTGEIA